MEFWLLSFTLFFVVAVLYSSIGHAGASGYLAVMALLSFVPESIKPTSLVLNILVSAIASFKFLKEGYFDKKIFFSFIIFSLPFAYWGGSLKLDPFYFKIFAGIFLIASSVFMLMRLKRKEEKIKEAENIWVWAASIGSLIGFISGIIGVGGGIFLTPLIALFGWTSLRKASGISALFIFCNSVSGLMGHYSSLQKIDANIIYWSIAVIMGGILGSYLGTKKFNNKAIVICLFIVLMSAGLKFILVDSFR